MARLLLIGIFVTAAVMKLSDRTGSRRAIIDFGLPSSIATVLGYLLPFVELAVASLLLIDVYAWWGALSGLVLLLLFSIAIGINLILGRKPNCHCFGQLHSSAVDWKVLLRNGFLAVIATFIVIQGPGSAHQSNIIGWLGALRDDQLEWLIIGTTMSGIAIIISYFLIHLRKENRRLTARLDALESKFTDSNNSDGILEPSLLSSDLQVGFMSPAFTLMGTDGKTYTLNSLCNHGKPVMLVFTDPNCGPCNALLPQIGQWQKIHDQVLTISIISQRSSEVNLENATKYSLENVLLQQDREASQLYGAYGTPSAILIYPDGTIASSLVKGAEQISKLLAYVVKSHSDSSNTMVTNEIESTEEYADSNSTPYVSRDVGDPSLAPRPSDIKDNYDTRLSTDRISRRAFLRILVMSMIAILLTLLQIPNLANNFSAAAQLNKSQKGKADAGTRNNRECPSIPGKNVCGSCQKVIDHIKNKGVDIGKSGRSEPKAGYAGWTEPKFANPKFADNISEIKFNTTKDKVVLYCANPNDPCRNCNIEYDDRTECTEEGPKGFNCNIHHDCRRHICKEAIVEGQFSSTPETYRINWFPKGGLTSNTNCMNEKKDGIRRSMSMKETTKMT
jgi:peroxiredoxin/uncharacterized membrane protein YphA (DoxX/SURF4 family)